MTSTTNSPTTTPSLPKYKYTNTQIQLLLKLSMLYFWKRLWCEDLKNNVHEYLMCKYTNTNTQIHKCTNTQIHKQTNTALVKVAYICYIFEKNLGTRTSKTIFPGVWRVNTQILKYGMNQSCTLAQQVIYFWKVNGTAGDLKNNISRCLTCKYTNTNTQIQLCSKLKIAYFSPNFSFRNNFLWTPQWVFFDHQKNPLCVRSLKLHFCETDHFRTHSPSSSLFGYNFPKEKVKKRKTNLRKCYLMYVCVGRKW